MRGKILVLEGRGDTSVKNRGNNALNQRHKRISLCIYEEDVRIEEVQNHFHVLGLTNGNAKLGLLVIQAKEIIS